MDNNNASSGPYAAVTAAELICRLGTQCSPDSTRAGYLIGPDVNGRICHIASYFSMADARDHAAKLNAKHASR